VGVVATAEVRWEAGRALGFAWPDGDGWRLSVDPRLPKVFVHPLALAGEAVTLESPHDHVHHRGLMFALRVQGVNFWEEGADGGLQRAVAVGEVVCQEAALGCRVQVAWCRGDRVLVRESRTLRATRAPGGRGYVLTWTSEFGPAAEDLTLDGETPWRREGVSYHGLGIRFARAMDHGGVHRDAEGREGAGPTHGVRARWHDYSARLDGTQRPVGVTLMDHPANPGHPTTWFAMDAPFAYVSASPVAREPLRLAAGERLRLRYGVWVHPGAAEGADAEAVYRAWVAETAP
jgi:hypothetical protein